MTTYRESGVNIELGDTCSQIAYNAAKATFPSREGLIGSAVIDDGGFAGLIDMGDYYLVQNDDGVGTKILIAEHLQSYDTLGYDLLAMVADDAVCIGAETISISNTLDVDKVDPQKVTPLLNGLKEACIKHKVIIPGGEIAEMNNMVNGYIWNATAVGIVEKHKLITGKNIQSGDLIIGLKSAGFRANGFTLVRHILTNAFGPDWYHAPYDQNQNWGQAVLTPSIIYSSAILEMHGRFKKEPIVEIKGIAHITGGGIHGNLARTLKKTGLKADLHTLPKPHPIMEKLIEIGKVPLQDAYNTWNMGIGMILIANDFDKISEICTKHQIQSQIIGKIV
ncbi:phosphoribosylformylglycinamidine cyclo-ligase [Candidatus Peregrinibacteria bacterium HGW-Peregrinibacteria-1]|jgi:phosphoribosylformylglycinamidine cyclo-ligase|nr:MAG: phosphoribosylformylglycinamidine cyclo-ligase [Candidatus Peregrinibacteria bacterium HGW-Peregrinibacteria-1]